MPCVHARPPRGGIRGGGEEHKTHSTHIHIKMHKVYDKHYKRNTKEGEAEEEDVQEDEREENTRGSLARPKGQQPSTKKKETWPDQGVPRPGFHAAESAQKQRAPPLLRARSKAIF